MHVGDIFGWQPSRKTRSNPITQKLFSIRPERRRKCNNTSRDEIGVAPRYALFSENKNCIPSYAHFMNGNVIPILHILWVKNLWYNGFRVMHLFTENFCATGDGTVWKKYSKCIIIFEDKWIIKFVWSRNLRNISAQNYIINSVVIFCSEYILTLGIF